MKDSFFQSDCLGEILKDCLFYSEKAYLIKRYLNKNLMQVSIYSEFESFYLQIIKKYLKI